MHILLVSLALWNTIARSGMLSTTLQRLVRMLKLVLGIYIDHPHLIAVFVSFISPYILGCPLSCLPLIHPNSVMYG